MYTYVYVGIWCNIVEHQVISEMVGRWKKVHIKLAQMILCIFNLLFEVQKTNKF